MDQDLDLQTAVSRFETYVKRHIHNYKKLEDKDCLLESIKLPGEMYFEVRNLLDEGNAVKLPIDKLEDVMKERFSRRKTRCSITLKYEGVLDGEPMEAANSIFATSYDESVAPVWGDHGNNLVV